jgi:hypothetical protein
MAICGDRFGSAVGMAIFGGVNEGVNENVAEETIAGRLVNLSGSQHARKLKVCNRASVSSAR